MQTIAFTTAAAAAAAAAATTTTTTIAKANLWRRRMSFQFLPKERWCCVECAVREQV